MARFLEERARQSGKAMGEIEAAFSRTQRPTSHINRLIEHEEVASLVLYVASTEASAVTGALPRATARRARRDQIDPALGRERLGDCIM